LLKEVRPKIQKAFNSKLFGIRRNCMKTALFLLIQEPENDIFESELINLNSLNYYEYYYSRPSHIRTSVKGTPQLSEVLD
jgi:hypothetical protein